ncbi:MAG: hypothetical protein GF409_03915 [Candidatus Omnitrophica bacterium]|nr:hypothetical protein [Candidatus Omnitrophota bacterium]
MYILGLSAFFRDSAAALIKDGAIVAAAQEERFTRKKHDGSFPCRAAGYCLKEAGIRAEELDAVAFHGTENREIAEKRIREDLGFRGKVLFIDHYRSHASSAFYPSPYEQAAVVTLDDISSEVTGSLSLGRGNSLVTLEEMRSPDSLGLLYSAFTHYCGFSVNADEYKLMGLAPYGEGTYVDTILDNILKIEEDGTFSLDGSYFDERCVHSLTNGKFDELFDGVRRRPWEKIEKKHMDLARSVQIVTEMAVKAIVLRAKEKTGLRHLCMAGSVALNCVSNGKLLEEGCFEGIWIQPSSGDEGGALGAALAAYYGSLRGARKTSGSSDAQNMSLLGPSYTQEQIEAYLVENDIVHRKMDTEELLDTVADLLAGQNIIGWFQGRMEYGPRALGSRSILADPRCRQMQSVINDRVKYREPFRPFAPSVLFERRGDYFRMRGESPYMLFAVGLNEQKRLNGAVNGKLKGMDKLRIRRSEVAAVTHIDYTSRVQTVTESGNPMFHGLLKKFFQRHGCPMLVNTSFNIKGEPIVCTPGEAYNCFMGTGIDYLVMDRFLIRKEDNRKRNAKKEEIVTCGYF